MELLFWFQDDEFLVDFVYKVGSISTRTVDVGSVDFRNSSLYSFVAFLKSLHSGENIGPKSQRPLHYKGSFFNRIIKGSMAQDYRADGHDCISCDVV
ncbi:hypothetical protein OIU76_011483 [Salix suchowensis]|nr:hypothetical protein OIU76_011483 [Salix suchowensis]